MEYIVSEELESALSRSYRQYLVGHLIRPQPYLKNIEGDIEVGISEYKTFTADLPHVHPVATEHGYVLQGSIKVRCFEERTEEKEFKEGDFFVIRPGISHATKNAAGTRVLFIKSPGINDKTTIEVDDNTKEWLKAWEL